MPILKFVVKARLLLPGKWLTPNAKDPTIIQILVESIKHCLMMNVGTISQKIDSLFISFFSVIVFRKL
jgi:hypothetical protein